LKYDANQISSGVQASDDQLVNMNLGVCKIEYDDGSTYKGDLKNGNYHGYGIFK